MKNATFALAAILFSITLGTAGASPLAAHQPENPRVVDLRHNVQYESRYCQNLRYGCLYKRRLGERGEGNCRRYREECGGYTGARYDDGYEGGGRYRSSYCQRLRNACIYKESRGEVGEGNCRRYREECRE